MKNFKLFSLGFLTIALACTVFFTQPKIDQVLAETKIVVVGEGSVSATPNVATIRIGVETRKEILNEAVEENNKNLTILNQMLLQEGFSEEDVQTKSYYVYEKFDYSEGEKLIGYQVSSTLEVKTKDLDNLSALITKLTQNGANRVEGITFSCDSEQELYEQAIQIALKNAKVKASALFPGELSVSKITEEYCYVNTLYRDFYSSEVSGKEISKGTVKVSAKVVVEFEAE